MRSSESAQAIFSLAAPILRKQSGIAAAYLLGSALLGTLRADSDIDIALLPIDERGPALQERVALAAELELALGRPVDIGVLSAKNLVYSYEAILRGKRIITLDQAKTDVDETRLMGCYLQFRQDRGEVEEAYYAA